MIFGASAMENIVATIIANGNGSISHRIDDIDHRSRTLTVATVE